MHCGDASGFPVGACKEARTRLAAEACARRNIHGDGDTEGVRIEQSEPQEEKLDGDELMKITMKMNKFQALTESKTNRGSS